MSYITELAIEINADPLVRNYSAMSNVEVVTSLNTKDREQNRDSMSGAEIWESTDSNQFDALSDVQKSQWLALCGITSLDPFGPAVSVAVGIFGAGTQTIINLSAARKLSLSRAQELNFQTVKEGHVEMARAL